MFFTFSDLGLKDKKEHLESTEMMGYVKKNKKTKIFLYLQTPTKLISLFIYLIYNFSTFRNNVIVFFYIQKKFRNIKKYNYYLFSLAYTNNK